MPVSNKILLRRSIIYIFCLYVVYLYVAMWSEVHEWQYTLPTFYTFPVLFYFDVCVLLGGGITGGILLIRMGKTFNFVTGICLIFLNLILTPVLIASGIN